MKERTRPAPVFKPYDQKQQFLIPPSYEELVPRDHPARLINTMIEEMDLTALYQAYQGGGASSYEPKMLLKVLILAYTQKTYSSRRIAKALRENIVYRWIAAGNEPDFRTIAHFRTGQLKEAINAVFASMVEAFIEQGHIKLGNYFLDGTKIEADANKYSFVWKKATATYKARLEEKIRGILAEIDQAEADEEAEYGAADLDERDGEGMSAQRLKEVVERMNRKLAEAMDGANEIKKKVRELEKTHIPKLQEYEEKLATAGSRGSYSKTDHDATFMGMKEDAMRNHQLKPAYNIQMGTEGQFIVGYSVHQSSTDTGLMVEHLEGLKESLGRLPETVVADAGYGSEENYAYLEQEGVEGYVKYNSFHREKRRKVKNDPYRKENFPYDEQSDSYLCPAGKALEFTYETRSRTKNGYVTLQRIYRAHGCEGCIYREACCRGAGDRTIHVNRILERYRNEARELLDSERGIELRKLRCIEIESVWGHIKHDRGFRRFLTRGIEKVRVEWGVIAMAHNILKANPVR